MDLVSLKKFERHVCLTDCCRISFIFLLLGILWNFLEGVGSNYPQNFVRRRTWFHGSASFQSFNDSRVCLNESEP